MLLRELTTDLMYSLELLPPALSRALTSSAILAKRAFASGADGSLNPPERARRSVSAEEVKKYLKNSELKKTAAKIVN